MYDSLEEAIATLIQNDATVKSYFTDQTVVIKEEGSLTRTSFDTTDYIITVMSSQLDSDDPFTRFQDELIVVKVYKAKRTPEEVSVYPLDQINRRIRHMLNRYGTVLFNSAQNTDSCFDIRWNPPDGPYTTDNNLNALYRPLRFRGYLYSPIS